MLGKFIKKKERREKLVKKSGDERMESVGKRGRWLLDNIRRRSKCEMWHQDKEESKCDIGGEVRVAVVGVKCE